MYKKLLSIVLIALISFSTLLARSYPGPEQFKKDQTLPPDFKEFCQKVLDTWNVPGFGVVVVKDGEIIFADGFGTTALDSTGVPVTAQTQFVLASTSKALTAALLGTYVDEDLVKWDDPVVKHLDDFKFYDEWITQNFLVRDIMTHKTGFRAYATDDLPHFGYTRDEIYKIFRHLEFTYPYRTTYAYNNALFTVAAKIVEKYYGGSWDDAIIDRLFKPLGMNQSTTGNKVFYTSDNLAKGHFHYRRDSVMVAEVRRENESAFNWLSAVAPAGFVVSTAEDMGNWLKMLLNKGELNGKQILKSETVNFLIKPQTVVSMDTTGLYNYAQGWRIEHGRQGPLVYHTGLAYGYTSLVALVPDINMGVAVITNGGSTVNPQATIMRTLIQWYKKDKTIGERDWLQSYVESYFTPISPRQQRPERVLPEFDKPAKDFTGMYNKEDFGPVTIYEKEGSLYFKLKKVDTKMTYTGEDKFEIRVDGAGRLKVEFFRNKRGKVDSVTIDLGDPVGVWTKSK